LEIVVSSGLPVKGVDVRVEAGNPPTIVFTFGTGMNRWEQFKMPYWNPRSDGRVGRTERSFPATFRPRSRRRARLVSLFDGEPAGLDTEAGRWQTVCEEHGTICSHETFARARSFLAASAISEWCESCAEISEVSR
jgi:hypothetical protein